MAGAQGHDGNAQEGGGDGGAMTVEPPGKLAEGREGEREEERKEGQNRLPPAKTLFVYIGLGNQLHYHARCGCKT